jgi:hypothetical protein
MSDDETVKINDTDYLLSTNNLLSRIKNGVKQFKKTDNPDCFIEFQFAQYNNRVWIEYWKCTSEKGTGLVLMKDFLNYLLNSSQSIVINDFTVIQAYPKATAILNPRITDRSQEKLIKFYTAIGFDNIETVGEFKKVSGTISNIINKIADYKSKNVGGKKRKNEKTKKRRYTKRKK